MSTRKIQIEEAEKCHSCGNHQGFYLLYLINGSVVNGRHIPRDEEVCLSLYDLDWLQNKRK